VKLPFVTRRAHDARIRAKDEHIGRRAEEMATLRDVVALHLVAAGHPSTVVHDVTSFADALREALAANGVDLRLELARLEGTDL
jgi:hypothetical protein